MLSLVHRPLNGLASKCIKNLLSYQPSRPLQSPGSNLCCVPRIRIKHEETFSFYTPLISNELAESSKNPERVPLNFNQG